MKAVIFISKENKTNAMRILDRAGVAYTPYFYSSDGQIDGVSVAKKLEIPLEKCFKTLVTRGSSDCFVFVIPVAEELDLKASARAVGEKSVEMLHVKDLLKTTGYIRGGCSPVGMKKQFTTVIDESACSQPTITVSGGKIGAQMELSPQALATVIGAKFAHITLL